MKISPVSRSRRERLKLYDVERKNFVDSVDRVEKVEKVRKAKNDLQNENYALGNDSFYEHLKKSSEDIRRFAISESKIKKEIESDRQRKTEPSEDEIYSNAQKAVEAINRSIKSIRVIDAITGGKHCRSILNSQEAQYMKKIGIGVKNGFFQVDSSGLKSEISKNKSCVNIIFDPDYGMLKKTHSILQKAKSELVERNATKSEGEIIDRKV